MSVPWYGSLTMWHSPKDWMTTEELLDSITPVTLREKILYNRLEQVAVYESANTTLLEEQLQQAQARIKALEDDVYKLIHEV